MDKPFLALLFLFGFTGFLVNLILRQRHRSSILRAQTDLQNKLLDRLTGAEELRAFLESGTARTLIGALAGSPHEPQMRIVGALIAGFVTVAVGTAVLLFDRFVPQAPGVYDDVRPILVMAGYVSLLGGLGFLIAAAIAYRLLRSWESKQDRGR